MDFSVQVFLSAHTFYPSKLAPYGIVPHCSIWMLPRIGCRRCLILCVVQECYFWECYLTTIANMRYRPFRSSSRTSSVSRNSMENGNDPTTQETLFPAIQNMTTLHQERTKMRQEISLLVHLRLIGRLRSCSLQQSVTHGLRRGISRWFLISGLWCLFTYCFLFPVHLSIQNQQHYYMVSFAPVSMHMERERQHTSHWTNISITWGSSHLQ